MGNDGSVVFREEYGLILSKIEVLADLLNVIPSGGWDYICSQASQLPLNRI